MDPLFTRHLEWAYKLTRSKKKGVFLKAFHWMEALIQAAPRDFFGLSFKPANDLTLRQLYVTCLHLMIGPHGSESPLLYQEKQIRLSAIKIATRIYIAARELKIYE